jgi:DNA-binding LacI/PurR family transcriptional regulator
MRTPFKKDRLYLQLKESILNGKYKHGMRLPSEIDLTKEFSVSRITLRAALKLLEKDNLLFRIRPKGTFINMPNTNQRLILALVQEKNDIAEARNYILPGIQQAAREKGYVFELCPVDFIDKSFPAYRSKEIGGVVIFGGQYTGEEKYIQFLKAATCPVIMAGCHTGDVRHIGFAGIRPDRKGAWLDGLRALKKAGHTRIATLSDRRIQGFGFEYDEYYESIGKERLSTPELTFFSGYDPVEIKKNLQKILRMGSPPTAIMCYSDFYAMLLMRAAEEIKVKIPEDICVMGFSGYPGARFLNPPLATVDLNYFKMGVTVVELIARASDWFGKPSVAVPEIIMPHEVVIQQSAKMHRMELTVLHELSGSSALYEKPCGWIAGTPVPSSGNPA